VPEAKPQEKKQDGQRKADEGPRPDGISFQGIHAGTKIRKKERAKGPFAEEKPSFAEKPASSHFLGRFLSYPVPN
jgi:hypothetical protein